MKDLQQFIGYMKVERAKTQNTHSFNKQYQNEWHTFSSEEKLKVFDQLIEAAELLLDPKFKCDYGPQFQQADVSGSKPMQFISVDARKPTKINTYHVRWLEDGRPLILGACMWDGSKFDTMDEEIEGAQPDEWLDTGE